MTDAAATQLACRSTIASWRRWWLREVVTLEPVHEPDLRLQVARLQRRNEVLTTLLRLLFLAVRLTGARLTDERLPEGAAKANLLAALKRAATHVPLAVALRAVGLSSARYYAWQQPERLCQLDDRRSCPRTRPTGLTPAEVNTMHDMVLDVALRHMPIRVLAVHAQRIKRVFASADTWGRLIRERGWPGLAFASTPRSRPSESAPASRTNTGTWMSPSFACLMAPVSTFTP